jgi:hypothetical protein
MLVAVAVALEWLQRQPLVERERLRPSLEHLLHTQAVVAEEEQQMVTEMVHQVEQVVVVLVVDILERVFLQHLERQIQAVVVVVERITQLAVTQATTNLVQWVDRVWLYCRMLLPLVILHLSLEHLHLPHRVQ